jgi:hypothetical protein
MQVSVVIIARLVVHHRSVTRVSLESNKIVTRVPQECHKGVTAGTGVGRGVVGRMVGETETNLCVMMVLQGCYNGVTMVVQHRRENIHNTVCNDGVPRVSQ